MPRLQAEYRGFESHLGQLFFFPWKKRVVLGVLVDLFVVPLAFYLVVHMYMYLDSLAGPGLIYDLAILPTMFFPYQ